ncbi:MAG: pyrroline-5-carboxylate reductase, partial [Coriobacteriia bacterium]|nr:pyrroline-5-carboxylate reductase [Coriobacteriia bacterium]
MDNRFETLGTILFVGVGQMGFAIASALVAQKDFDAHQLVLLDHHPERLSHFADLGATIVRDMQEACTYEPNTVVLAIKPQHLEAFLDEHKVALADKLIISIAVGLTIASLQKHLGKQSRVVRVMPNLPAKIGLGASLICPSKEADATDIAAVQALFDAAGTSLIIEEGKFDAAGVLNGCTPAFFALIIDAFTHEAVKLGVNAQSARELLLQTMAGTARILQEEKIHPRAFAEQVSSPAGTTIAGVDVLNNNVEI